MTLLPNEALEVGMSHVGYGSTRLIHSNSLAWNWIYTNERVIC